MQLLIQNPDNIDLDTFCKYLCSYMYRAACDTSKFDRNQLKIWNTYLDNLFKDYEIKPTVQLIVKDYFRNLKWQKIKENNYLISVDKNVLFENTKTSIDMIAALINDGNLSIKGYPIFDKIYTDVKENLQLFYNQWRV